MLNILFLGEIVGRPGIQALKNGLDLIKNKYAVDYTIANVEGMTNGFGIGRAHSAQLEKLGVDLATGGEKLFYKIDMVEYLPKAQYILRGYNYPPKCPGRGYKIVTLNDRKFLIANLVGNADMKASIQNAFLSAESLLKKKEEEDLLLIVQFHASTTAEKNTMFHMLDGKAVAVIGTHTKVISADAHVSEKGTAYISDNGRVGSFLSVGGFDSQTEIRKFLTALPLRSKECWDEGIIEGVVVKVDEKEGKSVEIIPILEKVGIKCPGGKEN